MITSTFEGNIKGLDFKFVPRKNISVISARYRPSDGKIWITVPYGVEIDLVALYITKNFDKLKNYRENARQRYIKNLPQYISGEKIYFWGEPYTLKVVSDKKRSVKKVENEIVMTVPPATPREGRRKLLNEWYRAELEKVLPEVIERCEKITGVYAREFKIKNMNTRLGSCNVIFFRIWINLQVVKLPPECLEFVMLHELTHLIERKHTPRFYSYLDSFCPNWREIYDSVKKFRSIIRK